MNKRRFIKRIGKNNKAQATSIIYFFVITIAILICSIIVLKLVNTIVTPFQTQIGNMSAPAGEAVKNVQGKFTSWWDIFIVLLFIINVLLLFISAFLIDIHPAFVIVYIVCVFFMFIMGNYALDLLDNVWNKMATTTELAQSPMQLFIMANFNLIMLGIVILSGIIMYAKFKWFGSGMGGSTS